MKRINNYIKIGFLVSVIAIHGCESVEVPDPSPASQTTGLSARFLLVNASPDAPALDLYINGAKIGNSATFPVGTGYTTAPIFGNNTTGNTSIRVKGASAPIGGTLGTNDVVFRASSTNFNNFTALDQANINGANYSIFVVDTIARPVPLRTLNASGVADLTYFNTKTGTQISSVDFAALSASDKLLAVSLGVIPAGTTDPGGARFWISQDIFRPNASLSPASLTSTQAEIRVFNTVPNSVSYSNNLPGNTPNPVPLYVRLRPSTGTTLTLTPAAGAFYFMSVAGGFTPSAGSRVVTAGFTAQTIAAGTPVVPISYTLEVSTSATFATVVSSATLTNVTFTPGKAYSIYVAGLLGKTDSRKLTANIIQHN